MVVQWLPIERDPGKAKHCFCGADCKRCCNAPGIRAVQTPLSAQALQPTLARQRAYQF